MDENTQIQMQKLMKKPQKNKNPGNDQMAEENSGKEMM